MTLIERPTPSHPAKYSVIVLDAIESVLLAHYRSDLPILDPYAGIGRIHDVGLRLGLKTVGVELEPEWANAHPQTIVGDALHLPDDWSERFGAVITSPPYANRMADSYAGDAKQSRRHTYRIALGRPLTAGSSAGMQWGSAYREHIVAFLHEANRVLAPEGLLVVNISNHVRKSRVVDVCGWFKGEAGNIFDQLEELPIPTPRNRHGANHAARADHEMLYVFRKAYQ